MRKKHFSLIAFLRIAAFAGFALLLAPAATAQESPSGLVESSTPSVLRDYSKGHAFFPLSIRPFMRQPVPGAALDNSPSLNGMVKDGKLDLSVGELVQAVLHNNLSIDSARYTLSIADADILKAKSGSTPTGSDAAGIPLNLGSVSFSGGGNGNANTSARSVSVAPRGSFDPALNLNFSIDTVQTPQNNSVVSGVSVLTTHANVLQTRYSQAFTTGTSFSLNFNVGRQSSTSRNLRFNPSLTSNYNLSVNQQLFSGFGFGMNRRFLTITKTNRESANQYFALQVITQLVSAENQYWDMVAAVEKVRASEQALTVSQQLLSDNQKQAQIGTLAPLDVVSAESEVAGRRRDLIVAQTAEQLAELKLKNMIVRRLDDPLASAAVHATDALPEPQDSDVPSFDEALAAALRNRPEINQAQASLRNLDVAVDYTKAKLRPTVSIFGLLSSQARGGTIVKTLGSSGITDVWSQVWSLDFPEYAFGFSVSFPLGNRAAQADHQNALLIRQQSETSLQRTRDQVRLEVRNAIIGLVQAKSQIAAAHMAVQLSQQTLDAEQKKLRAGTSTSYNVITVQRDLLNAELAEVQARVNYAKALVEMDRSTGTTLEKRHVNLDQVVANLQASNQASTSRAATP